MKTRYWIAAAALTVLTAACDKDGNDAGDGSKGKFRFGATTKDFSGRTALGEDGKTVTWLATDELGVCGVSDGVFSGNAKFTTSDGGITSGGKNAVFSGSPLVAGDYVAYYPYDAAHGNSLEFTLPATQTQAADSRGHVGENDVLVSDPVTVSDGQLTANLRFNRLHALLRLSVKLNGNVSGVTVSKITIASDNATAIFNRTTTCSVVGGRTTFAASNPASALSVEVSGSPAVGADGMFNIWMLVPETDYNGQVNVTVSSSAGDFTFTKPSVKFERGQSYYITNGADDGLILPVAVTSADEWEAAVTRAEASGQAAEFIIGKDVTLPAGASFPSVPLTLSGPGTVTLTPEVPQVNALSDDVTSNVVLDPSQRNAEVAIPDNLTVACGLAVNNGIIRGKNLTLADGGTLAGPGRLSLSGTLTVASGASATVAGNMVVGCNTLANAGTVANNGSVYYGSQTGTVPAGNTFNKASCQISNSDFETWFQKKIYSSIYSKNTWFLGEDDGTVVWASGNGDPSATNMGSTAGGTGPLIEPNPTAKETTYVQHGSAAVKMYSTYIGGLAAKFAAGNIFLGKYKKFIMSPKGAEFTFGYDYTKKPIALTGWYSYYSENIDYVNNAAGSGAKDQCNIYVALSRNKFEINTNNPGFTTAGGTYPDLVGDDHIVAYGEIVSDENTTSDQDVAVYKPFRVELKYKVNSNVNAYDLTAEQEPLYILIVVSSSKDGDAFTGSTKSVMYIDNFNLEF